MYSPVELTDVKVKEFCVPQQRIGRETEQVLFLDSRQ